MRRKTSGLPSCVYKYRLYAPIEGADAAERVFQQTRIHYNKLITIEHRRREAYRQARARLFPELGALEAQQHELEARIKALRDEVQAEKSRTRSRAVDPTKKAAIAALIVEKKALIKPLREARAPAKRSIELYMESDTIDARAAQERKDLRGELYWGTYLLVENAVKQATGASADPDYKLEPPHRLKSRLGVQIQGGATPTEIVGGDGSFLRINPVHFRLNRHNEEIATGKAARTTLQFKIGPGSTEKDAGVEPIWVTLPMVQHRPLPADARIKEAFITRQHFTVRIPWQYHLCVVLESPTLQQTLPGVKQEGNTTINFGWRSTERGIRVAMINRDGQVPEEVLLPPYYLGLERLRRRLTGHIADHFNAAKALLGAWMRDHTYPDGFREAFKGLANWRSQHRFAEWMDYWQEHRFAGDEEIFARLAAREDPAARERARLAAQERRRVTGERQASAPWTEKDVAAASWMVRYRHLQTWLDSVQRKLGNWRDHYYWCLAKRLATTSTALHVENFDIRKVAKRPAPEEPEDQQAEKARSNRQLAAVSDLRNKIKQAGAKYHCPVFDVEATNNTRRCDVCGELHPWEPKKKIMHICANPNCGAEWDQDVNNTDRQHTRIASGEMMPLVIPAMKAENGDVVEAKVVSSTTARKALRKAVKSK
jgi:hypothetical protein